MDIRLGRLNRLLALAETFGGTVCGSTPDHGNGNLGGGGGAPAGQPPAAGGQPPAPPAPPHVAPPAPPAPPHVPAPGIPAEDYAAMQKRLAKAEKEADALRTQLKDPGFLRGVINNALGVKDDVDPNVLLQQTKARAEAAEAMARQAVVRSAVVSAASEFGVHNPMDVADLFPASGYELEDGRVKDYGAVKAGVQAFLQARPYMLRTQPSPTGQPAPAAGAPGTPPAAGAPQAPALPNAPAGAPPATPPFRILTDAELWTKTPKERAEYIEGLKKLQNGGRNGMPWQ